MAAGVPQRPHQSADRRRREPLRGEHRQSQEGGGGERYHRIRHGVAQRLCAHAQDDGRGGGLRGDHRSEQPGREAGDAAHAVRRSAGDHALERERRLPLSPHQHARGDELGRTDRGPDDTRLRTNQSPAEEAGVLGEGLPQQLPQLQLRFREQAAAAHGRIRRPVAKGQHRYVGYAAVVDRARLRWAAADR